MFKGIKGRDRVFYRDRFGVVRAGKANALLLFPEHVVVDAGGHYGKPVVVSETNYVYHRSPR